MFGKVPLTWNEISMRVSSRERTYMLVPVTIVPNYPRRTGRVWQFNHSQTLLANSPWHKWYLQVLAWQPTCVQKLQLKKFPTFLLAWTRVGVPHWWHCWQRTMSWVQLLQLRERGEGKRGWYACGYCWWTQVEIWCPCDETLTLWRTYLGPIHSMAWYFWCIAEAWPN